MDNDFVKNEFFAGCDCMDICHVMHFVNFPPKPDEKYETKEECYEDNVVYTTVRVRNYFDRIIPPLRYFYELYDWRQYFWYHWFHRIGFAARYMVNPLYKRKWGILDCFNFQNKDLDEIDSIMALVTSDIDASIDDKSVLWIDNDQWLFKFNIDRMIIDDDSFPWELGWEPHFRPRGFFGRLKWGFNYIFSNYSDEQSFEIYEKEAKIIRGMIKWVQDNNEKKSN